MKSKKKKVKKPLPIDIDDYLIGWIERPDFGGLVYLTKYESRDKQYMNAKDCLKLSAWLARAAEYLKQESGK